MRFAMRSIGLVVVGLSVAGLAWSQQEAPPASRSEAGVDKRSHRNLNGHTFLLPIQGLDPFITQHLGSTTGFGFAPNVTIPLHDSTGTEIGKTEGNTAFLAIGLNYQHAFNDRFAMRAGVSGNARTGTSTEALLARGLSAIYSFDLGGAYRITSSKKYQLSISGDVAGDQIVAVDPLGFAKEIVDTGKIPEGGLVRNTKVTTYTLGPRFAYGFSSFWGVMALLEGGVVQPWEEEQDNPSQGLFKGALVLSSDFGAVSKVPLGVAILTKWETFSSEGDQLIDDQVQSGAGLYYTGRQDLDFSLQLLWDRAVIRDPDVTVNSARGLLNIRYYF